MPDRFVGKVVALAGAGGTMGTALAAAFAAEGAHLVLGDLDPSSVVVPAGVGTAPPGGETLRLHLDVSRPDSTDLFVEQAMEQYGRLDIMINNAGILSPNGRIHNHSVDVWQHAFEVNVLGAINGTRSAVLAMRGSGGGAIVNTASVAGLTAWAHSGPYSVTKAAVIQLTKVAALEYARDNIRVNCVCPGVFPSRMHIGFDDKVMTSLADRHPLGLGSPEQVVGAFLYLSSDHASWTTGSALVVDGGYSAP
jgi:3-oxoacyl-[acyl-carrier protein] reductase